MIIATSTPRLNEPTDIKNAHQGLEVALPPTIPTPDPQPNPPNKYALCTIGEERLSLLLSSTAATSKGIHANPRLPAVPFSTRYTLHQFTNISWLAAGIAPTHMHTDSKRSLPLLAFSLSLKPPKCGNMKKARKPRSDAEPPHARNEFLPKYALTGPVTCAVGHAKPKPIQNAKSTKARMLLFGVPPLDISNWRNKSLLVPVRSMQG
jgi:hypothetical protein